MIPWSRVIVHRAALLRRPHVVWQRHPNIRLALDKGLQQLMLITAALQRVIRHEKERIAVSVYSIYLKGHLQCHIAMSAPALGVNRANPSEFTTPGIGFDLSPSYEYMAVL